MSAREWLGERGFADSRPYSNVEIEELLDAYAAFYRKGAEDNGCQWWEDTQGNVYCRNVKADMWRKNLEHAQADAAAHADANVACEAKLRSLRTAAEALRTALAQTGKMASQGSIEWSAISLADARLGQVLGEMGE